MLDVVDHQSDGTGRVRSGNRLARTSWRRRGRIWVRTVTPLAAPMTPLSWEHWASRYEQRGLAVITPGYRGIEPGEAGVEAIGNIRRRSRDWACARSSTTSPR